MKLLSTLACTLCLACDAFLSKSNHQSQNTLLALKSSQRGTSSTDKTSDMYQQTGTDRRSMLKSFGAGFLTVLGAETFLIKRNKGSRFYNARAAEKLEYLTEPTEEFKAIEKKQEAFMATQIKLKKLFNQVVGEIEVSSNQSEIVEKLDSLTEMVTDFGGLPEGIKRDSLIKRFRKIKAVGTEKKFWSTPAELSYKKLIKQINYQQSPNTDKDMANPL